MCNLCVCDGNEIDERTILELVYIYCHSDRIHLATFRKCIRNRPKSCRDCTSTYTFHQPNAFSNNTFVRLTSCVDPKDKNQIILERSFFIFRMSISTYTICVTVWCRRWHEQRGPLLNQIQIKRPMQIHLKWSSQWGKTETRNKLTLYFPFEFRPRLAPYTTDTDTHYFNVPLINIHIHSLTRNTFYRTNFECVFSFRLITFYAAIEHCLSIQILE